MKILRKISLVAAIILMVFAPTNTAMAITEEERNFYAQNHIIGYDPSGCFSGSAFGGGSVSLEGNTVPAKVVNYLNGNNPSGFKLSANAIAGILANFQGESAFNPFRFEGDSSGGPGYGIAQFTPMSKITNKLSSDSRTAGFFNQYFNVKYSSTNAATGYPNESVPESVLDAWLLVQLDYFFGPSSEFETTRIGSYRHMGGEMGLSYISDSMTVHQAMDAAQTPEDAARIFVWIMERPKNKEGASSNRASMAKEWYGKITSGGGVSGGSSSNTAAQSNSSVTIIGDSITEGSKSQILEKIPGADISSAVGRHFNEGISILEQKANSGSLGGTVIFALGTNDANGVTSAMAEKVVSIAGKSRNIIFVNNHTTKADYTSNNNVFSKIANSSSNVSVADWRDAILSKESQYLASDGIHPNEAGKELFASLLANGGKFAAATSSYSLCAIGGMNGENISDDLAEAIIRFYNSSEADQYMGGLLSKTSCVTFVHVFLRKFTTLGPSVVYKGNGRDTARVLAAATGLPTSSTPVAISVFSYDSNYVMCGAVGCGHTGIVAAVNGDDITIMEAGYKGSSGNVRHVKASNFPSGTLFVNINSVIDTAALNGIR